MVLVTIYFFLFQWKCCSCNPSGLPLWAISWSMGDSLLIIIGGGGGGAAGAADTRTDGGEWSGALLGGEFLLIFSLCEDNSLGGEYCLFCLLGAWLPSLRVDEQSVLELSVNSFHIWILIWWGCWQTIYPKSMELTIVVMILKYYLFYFLCFFGAWHNPFANSFDNLIGCFSCLNYVQNSSNYHFYCFHCLLIGKVSHH